MKRSSEGGLHITDNKLYKIFVAVIIVCTLYIGLFNSCKSNKNLLYNDNTVVTSIGLLGYIERHEGFYAKAYRGEDSQNLTIGYGHVIFEGDTLDDTTVLTPQQAEDLLKSDLKKCEQSVNKEFTGVILSQPQHDALVDFAFNLGPYIWYNCKLAADIKNGASPDVLLNDFIAYDHCNGVELAGLKTRRYDEWKLFCYGDYGF